MSTGTHRDRKVDTWLYQDRDIGTALDWPSAPRSCLSVYQSTLRPTLTVAQCGRLHKIGGLLVQTQIPSTEDLVVVFVTSLLTIILIPSSAPLSSAEGSNSSTIISSTYKVTIFSDAPPQIPNGARSTQFGFRKGKQQTDPWIRNRHSA